MPNSDDDLALRGLIQAFNLQPQEVPETRQNLVGFFDLLLQIDKRLNPNNYQPQICSTP